MLHAAACGESMRSARKVMGTTLSNVEYAQMHVIDTTQLGLMDGILDYLVIAVRSILYYIHLETRQKCIKSVLSSH